MILLAAYVRSISFIFLVAISGSLLLIFIYNKSTPQTEVVIVPTPIPKCNEQVVLPEIEIKALYAIDKSLNGGKWGYTGSRDKGIGLTIKDNYNWPISAEVRNGKILGDATNVYPCKWYGITCSCNGHIVALELGLANLQGNVPAEIGDLSHLIRLGLSYNQIRSLPPEIGQLKHLEQMDLTYSAGPNSEALALPKLCIYTHNGKFGLGCKK